MMRHTTAVGVFSSRAKAYDAVHALRDAGFLDSSIGVVSRDGAGHDSGVPHDPTHSRWEEGTGVGAATGAATGLGLGLAVAAGMIPAIGPVIAGGTLMALAASAGAGAAVGTVVGGLIGLGIPEDEAGYYDSEFRSGRTLVTVQAGSRFDEATSILRRYGTVERPAEAGARV